MVFNNKGKYFDYRKYKHKASFYFIKKNNKM